MEQVRVGRSTRSSPRRSTRAATGRATRVDALHGVSRAGVRRSARRHARASGNGTGVLNHTVSGSDWHNLWFNDTLVGETGINAALCGTWNCPVLMVSGTTQPAAKG